MSKAPPQTEASQAGAPTARHALVPARWPYVQVALLASLSPWTILPLARLRGYYPQHSRGSTSFYRRKEQY